MTQTHRAATLLVTMHLVGEVDLSRKLPAERKVQLREELKCTRAILEAALKAARMQLDVPVGVGRR